MQTELFETNSDQRYSKQCRALQLQKITFRQDRPSSAACCSKQQACLLDESCDAASVDTTVVHRFDPSTPTPLQGLPLGSGLGSSAASAAAAAAAVNGLFGNALPDEQLVLAGLQSEAVVSGYHADNIAPAIMGGFTLVRSELLLLDRAANPAL